MKQLFFVCCVISLGLVTKGQVVFTSGPSSCAAAGGLACVASSCNNANNASDGSISTFATVSVLVGVVCTNTITSDFATLQTAGRSAGFLIRGTDLLTLISSVSMQITNTITSQTQGVTGISLLTLLGTDNGYVQFQTGIDFDRIELSLNGIVGVGQSIDVFAGYSALTPLVFALPVTLVSFEGNEISNKIRLNWSTASENNSDHFEIERSANGTHFYSIANIRAAGNSTDSKTYTFTDDSPIRGAINYYRLKLVDIDSRYTYSRILKIGNTTGNVFATRISPNPARNSIHFTVEGLDQNERLLFEIINTEGRLMYKEEVLANGSVMVKSITRPTIPAGTYFYRVSKLKNGQVLKGNFILTYN